MGAAWRRAVLAGGVLFAAGGASAADPRLDTLLACMRGNVPQTIQVQEIELSASERDGRERRMRGRLFLSRERQQLRAMLRMEAPADLAGSAYLLLERPADNDEIYVFIPALNRVRRINSGASDGKLWGTDISYSDLRQLGSAVSVSGTRWAGTERVDGRDTQRLVVSLPPSDSTLFSELQIWVDSESCLATRVDFVNGKTAHKRLSVDPGKLQRDGNYWYASEVTIADLDAGTRTRLTVLGMRLDKNLSDRIFGANSFHLGR